MGDAYSDDQGDLGSTSIPATYQEGSSAVAKGSIRQADSTSDAVRDAITLFVETTEKLIREANKVPSGVTAGDLPGPRLFFPNGIEVIFLKIKATANIEITIAIAGKDAK